MMDSTDAVAAVCRRVCDYDHSLESVIVQRKQEAIDAGDESAANLLWCFVAIYRLKLCYLSAFRHMKLALSSPVTIGEGEAESQKAILYERAWKDLISCEHLAIALACNYAIEGSTFGDYDVDVIVSDVERLQALFPYRFFFSRESIVKRAECSICGAEFSIRHPCGHIPGRVYCGRLCQRIITKMELGTISIVTNPHDKECICKVPGKSFDYSLLDDVVSHIEPYAKWSCVEERRLLPQYQGLDKGSTCPCGSGMPIEECLRENEATHYGKHLNFVLGKGCNLDGFGQLTSSSLCGEPSVDCNR